MGQTEGWRGASQRYSSPRLFLEPNNLTISIMETIIIYLMIAFCWFLEYIVPPLAVIGSIVMCVIVYGHAEEHPEDY